MSDEERVFKIGEDELYVRDPSLKIREQAETVKMQAWNKAMGDKALFKKEMYQMLKDRGIISEEDEAKRLALEVELQEHLEVLRKGGCSLKVARDAAIKANDIRQELLILSTPMSQHASMTIEGRSENKEFDYLVSQCVVYNKNRNKAYFSSYEDFLNKKSEEAGLIASNEVARVHYGIGDMDQTEEKQFLLKYKLVDEEFNFIDKDGNRVNRGGDLIDEDGRAYKIVRKKKVYLNKDEVVEFNPFLDEDGNPIDVE